MAGARGYRFVHAWAHVQIVVGLFLVVASGLAVLAVFTSWPVDLVTRLPGEWRARLAPAATVILPLAVVLGGSLVLSGTMLLLLRDIHRHVARTDARDNRRRLEPDRSPERPDATARLIPRR